MAKKFNIGDSIVCNGFFGQVINSFAEDGKFYYDVEWDDGEVETVAESDIEPIDRRDVFLSELKRLLEKYGAELGDSGIYEIEGMEVTFDSGDRIRYQHCTINALNIMDYEKE